MVDPSPAAPVQRHAARTIALHWVSAAAVFAAFGVAWWREAVDDKPLRSALLLSHSQLGLLVLSLLLLRVWARLRLKPPGHAAEAPRLQRWAATGSHLLFYGLLLAQPLLGWALMNAHGQAVTLFGSLPLPTMLAADPDLAESLADAHAAAAWGLLALIGLHVAAALWHHFIRRDGVLAAMWPRATLAPRTTEPTRSQRTPS